MSAFEVAIFLFAIFAIASVPWLLNSVFKQEWSTAISLIVAVIFFAFVVLWLAT